ncbi:MAG: hypothetical protein WD067_01870 [Gaiellaceae bacterium]
MRRRVASAVVVAAVAAVAVVAIVDAVRPLRPEPAAPLDAEAAAQLAELGVAGTLVYADADCGLHAMSLPGLTPAQVPGGIDVGCEISVSPDGRHVAGAGARWSPDGAQYAICRGTRVDVVDAAGGPARGTFTGCAPAFRPDGMLTFARDGAILEARPAQIVVPRSELERAAGTHPNAPELPIEELRVRDLAWTSRFDVVALVEARYRLGLPEFQPTIAGFRYGRLLWRRSYMGDFDRLVVSSRGEVLPEPPPRPFPFLTGRLRLAGPFDWSPDGRGMTVATRASVFVVDLDSQRHVRIPVTARDLAWR